MSIPLEASLVRIFATDGGVVGTGFLVGEMTVLTCAHVVATALGVAADVPIAPELAVSLDFPLVASGRRLSAQVIFWQPIQADDSGDIALLQVEHAPPDGTKAARLVIAEDLWEHPFRVFGFPGNHDQGVWVTGKLRAREATGWIQIEDVKTTGKAVQRGFSGGAVWDAQLEGVAGMVVAADEDASKVAYMIPAKVLIQVVPTLRQQAIPPCPYRGLFAFREQDAAYFFGRECFTQQLIDTIRTKPLVLVVGSSGSGKSSVVFAGLIPRLQHEGNWLIVSCRPGTHPFRNVAASLIPFLEPKMSETDRLVEIKKLADRLEQGTVALHDVIDRLQQIYFVAHLLVVVDQFEELYTPYHRGEEPRHFLETLLAAVAPDSHHASCDFHLLLTLRADFFGHALSYRPFADVLQNADVKLGPMTRQELQEAILKPAQKLHVQIEDGLTERLLDGVGSAPGNLPLLEFALSLLWTRQRAGTLTHAAYDEIGGVEQALALYAEEFYMKLEEEEQKQVQHIFTQLVQPGEGTEDIRRLATRSEIGKERWGIVIRLSDARLVVTGRNEATGQETVEVVHEAIIREWGRLHSWIEASREFRLWQERLRTLLHQWDTSNQDRDLLLRGALLIEAEQWLTQRPQAINEVEKAFIKASIAEKQRRETAEQSRQLLELRLKRQAVNRLRFSVIALSIFSAIVVVLASMVGVLLLQTSNALQTANRETQAANLEKQVAQSRALAANAGFSLTQNQIDRALLLSAKAYQTNSNYESRDSLLNALQYSPHLTTVLRSSAPPNSFQPVGSLMFSPDGRTLISSDDRYVPVPLSDGVSGDIASSLVGSSAAYNGLYGGITLWDMVLKQPHNLLLAPIKHPNGISSVAFTSDGQIFASGGFDGLWVWNAKTGMPLFQLKGPTQDGSTTQIAFDSRAIAFSPDGKLLAARCYCKEHILLWNLATKKLISSPIIGQGLVMSSFTFSPDGKLLAVAVCNQSCTEGRILFWDMTSGKPIGPVDRSYITTHGEVYEVKFSPDGKLLASANNDGTITLWNLASGQLKSPPLTGHIGIVWSIAFNSSGSAS